MGRRRESCGTGERAGAEDRGQGEVVRRDAPREHVAERAERLLGAAGARERREEGVGGGKRGGGDGRHVAHTEAAGDTPSRQAIAVSPPSECRVLTDKEKCV